MNERAASGEASGMDAVLLELLAAARRAGVRVSPAESMDAVRAASVIGLASRADLRAALSASVAKGIEERAVFRRVFDAFFTPRAPLEGAAERMQREGVSAEELEALRAAVAAGSGAGGGGLGALLEGGGELERRIEAALEAGGAGRVTSTMQIGLTALRALDALGVDSMQEGLAEARRQLPTDQQRAADGLAERIEALRREVRARVRDRLERAHPERLARSRAARLEREALVALDKAEVAQVTQEVERLGRALRDRLERQRRRRRRGRLDGRATVRASRRTGGVPFAPVFRARRRERPRLLVLCDVSSSVTAAARFLLVLVHAMQEAFSRTRSFVFVRDVGEATELFASHPVERAVALAFGGDAVPVGANSDYGRALTQLVAREPRAFDRRTTVVILGDGRSNNLDPGLEALAEIHRRAARVIWLNPEPRGSWGFGDSEMLRYAAFCTYAAPVRSLSELRVAVERLASMLSRS